MLIWFSTLTEFVPHGQTVNAKLLLRHTEMVWREHEVEAARKMAHKQLCAPSQQLMHSCTLLWLCSSFGRQNMVVICLPPLACLIFRCHFFLFPKLKGWTFGLLFTLPRGLLWRPGMVPVGLFGWVVYFLCRMHFRNFRVVHEFLHLSLAITCKYNKICRVAFIIFISGAIWSI